jgi:hypothetical protein
VRLEDATRASNRCSSSVGWKKHQTNNESR